MAAAAILDFRIFKFLTVETFQRVKLHHWAKFRWNRSNRNRDIVIFRFYKMAAAANLDFGNFKFLTVGTIRSFETLNRAKFLQNRSNRGRNMAIFRCFFKNYGRRHLGFSKFQISNGEGGQEGWTTSPRQISLKSAQTRPSYRDLSIFQDGGRQHLGF